MANDNRYNEERENATFAVNLRKLFEDKKATHNELACFIKEKTGDSITRQAVGQWCNGNSSPNLKTVPVIAEFFGVSSDYLLGMSDVKSTNVDVKTMCEMTGLSEEAINKLIFYKNRNEGGSEYDIPIITTIDRIIKEPGFFGLAIDVNQIESESKKLLDETGMVGVVDISGVFIVARVVGVSENVAVQLIEDYNKRCAPSDYKEKKNSVRDRCDMLRYRIIRTVERMVNQFDERYSYLDYNREQMLDFFAVSDEDLKLMEKGESLKNIRRNRGD